MIKLAFIGILTDNTFPGSFVLKGVIKDCVMRRPRQASSLYEGAAYREFFSSSH